MNFAYRIHSSICAHSIIVLNPNRGFMSAHVYFLYRWEYLCVLEYMCADTRMRMTRESVPVCVCIFVYASMSAYIHYDKRAQVKCVSICACALLCVHMKICNMDMCEHTCAWDVASSVLNSACHRLTLKKFLKWMKSWIYCFQHLF